MEEQDVYWTSRQLHCHSVRCLSFAVKFLGTRNILHSPMCSVPTNLGMLYSFKVSQDLQTFYQITEVQALLSNFKIRLVTQPSVMYLPGPWRNTHELLEYLVDSIPFSLYSQITTIHWNVLLWNPMSTL